MRFVKPNRNWVAAGRRLFSDQEAVSGAVAVEERNALLGNDSMMSVPVNEPMMKGDPTQHLLTALGRFQRQIAKAENGAPQGMWSDECMNQIIAGIEIALEQEWDGVKEALTDTARVLQSFEDAGKAQQCVSFLRDSYEILCLMVGDIIVDNVRSGVMQKWHERYQAIVDEMRFAGIRLVDDEARQEEMEARSVDLELREEETPVETAERGVFPEVPEMEAPEIPEPSAMEEADPTAPSTVSASAFILHPTRPAPEAQVPEPDVESEIEEEEEPETKEEEGEEEELEGKPDEPALETLVVGEPDGTPAAQQGAPPSSDLFSTVREAVKCGNVAEAKMLALQVALDMAKLEADREESRLRTLEAGLSQIMKAIQEARQDVARTQKNLEATERFAGESQAEFQARREHVESLHGRMAEIEGTMAGIDAQIRELEERREAEARRLESVQAELDEVLSIEGRFQSEMDSLADSEQTARAALELSERNVAALEQECAEREEEIAAARRELGRRKQAVVELERTITQIAGGPAAPAPGETGMLF